MIDLGAVPFEAAYVLLHVGSLLHGRGLRRWGGKRGRAHGRIFGFFVVSLHQIKVVGLALVVSFLFALALRVGYMPTSYANERRRVREGEKD
jgi:hypothetical protein